MVDAEACATVSISYDAATGSSSRAHVRTGASLNVDPGSAWPSCGKQDGGGERGLGEANFREPPETCSLPLLQ